MFIVKIIEKKNIPNILYISEKCSAISGREDWEVMESQSRMYLGLLERKSCPSLSEIRDKLREYTDGNDENAVAYLERFEHGLTMLKEASKYSERILSRKPL